MVKAKIRYSNGTVDFYPFPSWREAKEYAYKEAIKHRVGVVEIQYEEVKQCIKLNTIAY